ncbi:hypothetical protein L6452_39141 [Arctium lappa]|uniref:Uncharacterized protein n=1 Tax=Arctium lappa TaxID=4217 RepID=A0ACB8XRX6_ARCLA|nr:hypothetical protein L6452_39141 [Arctium lappa]
MPCGKQVTSGTSNSPRRAEPTNETPRLISLISPNLNSTPIVVFFSFFLIHISSISQCDMEYSLSPPVTEAQRCLVASEMTGDLNDFVEQEESSIMESPKGESSEWTNEKHSLYLKSMEASFVDQLYNSFNMRSSQTQNQCSSDSLSSRRIHANNRYPSGQFKVQQHGLWSRIDFKRENVVLKEAETPHVSLGNQWIQHFTNGSRHEAAQTLPPQEKPSSTAKSQKFAVSDSKLCFQQTSGSDTEVTDQNFVEDSAVEKVNTPTPCSKKRKSTRVSESGNDQAASFWHFSCHRNR